MDLNTLQFKQLDRLEIPLVNHFYKQVYKKGLANKSDQVFVLKKQTILCAARLKEIQGECLLTGVACAPEARKKGLASLLINKIINQQEQKIYCFPYPHLQHFYQQLGFELYDASLLPEKLAFQYQSYIKSKPLLCMLKQY
ncbi:GNAT family N-acetyltransferase [Psychromonas sp.]|nr:GNAT family N-acetyltransferase [Psychromonas sp.]